MGFLTDLADKFSGAAENKDKGEPALESISDQTKDDQELAAFVKHKVEDVRGQASRIAHEGIWMTNIAYALGFDSVYYDTSARQYKPVGGPLRSLSRNRVHCNLILPAMQNRLARMCKNEPKWETVPEDQSIEAREKASLDYDLLIDLWAKLELSDKRLELGMWLQQCGHAYLIANFDDEMGDPLVDPITGEFMGFEGDIKVEVGSAFEFFPDPKAKNLKEARWCVRAKVRDLSYFKDRYNRGDLVKEESAWLLSLQYELRINSLNNTGPNTSGVQEQMKNAAIELSYYERRSQKYPEGRHVVTANGVTLKNDVLLIGEFPFEKFDDIKVAGKYYSEAAVTHARPLQDQYNRNLARTSDWTNKMLAGKYIAARGHGLSGEALNDRTGEVIEYDNVPGAPPPSAMQVPIIPDYAYKERKEIQTDLFDQFGLSEVSRGQLPAAGIPAVGMQLLIEQDETRIGIEIESHEHAWARFMTKVLKFANRCYQTNRQIKKKSHNGYRFISFTGDDLSSEPDVRVVRGSTIPTSRALRRQDILNAYSQGLLGNQQDPSVKEMVLGELEYGNNSDIWKDYRLDMGQISEVIEGIKEGDLPEFNKLDNHALHIIQLNRFRKSESYADLDGDQKNMVEYLIQEHGKTAVEFQNPQLAQQISNTNSGLMPDGSNPQAILATQVKSMQTSDQMQRASQASMHTKAAAAAVPPHMAAQVAKESMHDKNIEQLKRISHPQQPGIPPPQ
jgi:hypothetical protein